MTEQRKEITQKIYAFLEANKSGRSDTDDIAIDDMAGAIEHIAAVTQENIDTYDLNAVQLKLVFTAVLCLVTPNDRLYAATEGEVVGKKLWGEIEGLLDKQ